MIIIGNFDEYYKLFCSAINCPYNSDCDECNRISKQFKNCIECIQDYYHLKVQFIETK